MSIPASALQNLIDLKTPPEEIKWRQGHKQHQGPCPDRGPCNQPHAQLAYIDARYVMRVLDTLIGPDHWQRVHTAGPGNTVFCGIGILVAIEAHDGSAREEWLWRWDGAGETDIEGEKGAVSDSFKRAAVSWGIGRDLYAMKPQSGRPSAVDAEYEAAIVATPTPAAPAQAAGGPFAPIGSNEGACPEHHKEWRSGRFGWYCSTKVGDGWCKQKPTKAWAAAHEK